jgi:hypothetical protein
VSKGCQHWQVLVLDTLATMHVSSACLGSIFALRCGRYTFLAELRSRALLELRDTISFESGAVTADSFGIFITNPVCWQFMAARAAKYDSMGLRVLLVAYAEKWPRSSGRCAVDSGSGECVSSCVKGLGIGAVRVFRQDIKTRVFSQED